MERREISNRVAAHEQGWIRGEKSLLAQYKGSQFKPEYGCPDCPNRVCFHTVSCVACHKLTCEDGLEEHYCRGKA